MKKTISLVLLAMSFLLLCPMAYATINVKFSPQPVSPGSKLEIKITASGYFYNTLYIYNESNKIVDTAKASCKKFNRCTSQTISYTIPAEWNGGDYLLYIYDYSSPAGWQKFKFEVLEEKCVNECSPRGNISCFGDYAKTCSNYDGDKCLEWSNGTYCKYGCSRGYCSAPINQSNQTLRTGNLYVYSVPTGANLCVDKQCPGTTPRTVTSLSAGSHSVNLTKAGYVDYKTTVDIHAGLQRNLTAVLKTK